MTMCDKCIKLEIQLSKSRTTTQKFKKTLSEYKQELGELRNKVKEHDYQLENIKYYVLAALTDDITSDVKS